MFQSEHLPETLLTTQEHHPVTQVYWPLMEGQLIPQKHDIQDISVIIEEIRAHCARSDGSDSHDEDAPPSGSPPDTVSESSTDPDSDHPPGIGETESPPPSYHTGSSRDPNASPDPRWLANKGQDDGSEYPPIGIVGDSSMHEPTESHYWQSPAITEPTDESPRLSDLG
ncbi:hypothetical protein B0H19DRAFT_1262576 [Mycena capillaripes]|nr:hypothetical protein B0H19DRAFT_1262576 [Mycena capillaripes]